MLDHRKIAHHPAIEALTEIICNRVQNEDRAFFRPLVAYYLMSTAATMRATLMTLDRGDIPVNGYVIAFGTSGTGKGHSTYLLENEIFADFRKTFIDYTLPTLAEGSLWKLASTRAAKSGKEEQEEYDKLVKEYENAGEYVFAFDDGSTAAVKQIRDKLLMAGAGSINFVVDEIGSNLDKIAPTMPLFLELFDQGMAKQKLLKSVSDNKRTAQLEGKTPANMLLFGVPHEVLDGGATEKTFRGMLKTGLARRSFFALGKPIPANAEMSDEELFDALCDPARNQELRVWADHMATLADPAKFNWEIEVPRDVGIAMLSYRRNCERRAAELSEFAEVNKAELAHRYFKALKLAGAFCFVEEVNVMTVDHLLQAIKLTEEAGNSFQSILTQEAPYMKLARYIASCPGEVTHADLLEALPFYPASNTPRTELLTNATSWGYKQHIIIKRRYMDDVEFLSGEALQRTNLAEVRIAHSEDWTSGYTPELAPFDQLDQLVTLPDYNWTVHAFQDDYREGDGVIPGFNLAVFDIDGTISRDKVHELMEDYTFMTYTTKRHTPAANRFRLILPMNYHLKLDRDDYKEFMKQLIEWLPFEVDEDASKDIARKWATNEHALVHYNLDKPLLDVLPFVPRTKRNDQRLKQNKELGSLDALERWFAHKIMQDGDRNNHMIRFALTLVDGGMGYNEVEAKVFGLDKKLPEPLGVNELRRTVLVTVAKKFQNSP